MSTNICNTCSNGNCPPNCPGNGNKNSSNWIIIVIILVLLGVLLVMAFIVAFDLYKKTQKANEPKNITVNKHIHSIKQAPIVVTSPQIIPPPQIVAPPVIRSRTVAAPAVVSRVVSTPVPSVASPVSYEVRSFRSPAPQIPEVRSFQMSQPVDFQAADFELPNDIVSYDGFNLDDVAYSPTVSALETPCENR